MNCDGLALHYQTLEYLSLGRQLERSRFTFLGEFADCHQALICGGGDGRFLARLLRVNARVRVEFVEVSARMLEIAERRVAGMGGRYRERVRFHRGDLRQFRPETSGYDLIVTNFFLDCFSDVEVQEMVSRLAGWAAPQARWMVSEFRYADSAAGRAWTNAVVRGLYLAFRVTTGLRVTRLPNYAGALSEAGFARQWEVRALGGLLQSSLWRSSQWGRG
jgi:ubiquinone/menaquinone biosynthesis C-methylase UbiE